MRQDRISELVTRNNPTICIARPNAEQSISTSAVRIQFDNVITDPDGCITTGSSWVFTAKKAGYHIFDWEVGCKHTGEIFSSIYLNGVNVSPFNEYQQPQISTTYNSMRCYHPLVLDIGDQVYVTLRRASGTYNSYANSWIYFRAIYF